MLKKIMVIFFIVISVVLISKLTMTFAQKYERDSDSIRKDDLFEMDEKIDKILSGLPEKGSQEKSNREISVKLDQVLLNQQKILSELEVVKVRATKR